jgi:cellulose synthase A
VAIPSISEKPWIFAESKYSKYMLSLFVLLIPGSPAILGDREEDVDADEVASDFNYTPEDQNQKQKIAERMLSWHMTYGRGEDVVAPTYDKEVSHNHIPLLTNGTEVIQQASEY